MLGDPPGSSAFDSWKGFDPSTPGKWSHDRVYLCVPGWEDLPSKASMPLLVEWAQHHLLQGVDHIFIGGHIVLLYIHSQIF